MFDLNLTIDCNDKENKFGERDEQELPATSKSLASSNDDMCFTCASSGAGDTTSVTLNFGILNGNDPDGKYHEAEMVTRELFPTSQFSELNPGSCSNISFDHDRSNQGRPEMVVQHHQQQETQQVQGRKSRRGPKSKSSRYRGVTFYRRTGRWESHIWDCGKQVYLGGFDTDITAARAYDRAAIKFRGVGADINFNLGDYEKDMIQMKNLSKGEFVQTLRRQNNGFPRGSCKYNGVSLRKYDRWEARVGQFLEKKAYDETSIKSSTRDDVTNFFNPNTYDSKMIYDEGSPRDLDLNLGISSSSLKEGGSLFSFQFPPHYGCNNQRRNMK